MRKDGTRCVGTKFEYNWMGRQLCRPIFDSGRDKIRRQGRKKEPLKK